MRLGVSLLLPDPDPLRSEFALRPDAVDEVVEKHAQPRDVQQHQQLVHQRRVVPCDVKRRVHVIL